MAIITQPVVEPDFWNRPETFWLWIVNAIFGYLAFGIALWLGKKIIDLRNGSESANILPVIAIAVIASMTRSITIGVLLEPLGLQGVNPVERLPFGAFLGFAWVITTALIMDTKYRFKFHLDEVIADQRSLLDQIHNVQDKISRNINSSPRAALENSHRKLQQSIRELAILSNSSKNWEALVPQLRTATLQLALSAKKEPWTADKDLNDLKSSRWKAIREITTKPLMNLPLVITATAVVTFFGGIRLYPIGFVLFSLFIGLGLHVAIILAARFIIQRQSAPSSFTYAVMVVAIFLTSVMLPIFPDTYGYNLFSMRGIALAATMFEVVWLVASGYVIYNQNQRQQIIANAQLENERLRNANGLIARIGNRFEKNNYDPTTALDLISEEINRARVNSDLQLARETLEFSSILFSQISDSLIGISQASIKTTLERVSKTSAGAAQVFWTFTGEPVPDSMQPRISAALEICVSKAIRHGEASVISVDIQRLGNIVACKVTDNGQDYVEAGSGLGIEILMDLTGGTWQRDRSGGLNIATAQFV
jgi:hypothetical protein